MMSSTYGLFLPVSWRFFSGILCNSSLWSSCQCGALKPAVIPQPLRHLHICAMVLHQLYLQLLFTLAHEAILPTLPCSQCPLILREISSSSSLLLLSSVVRTRLSHVSSC
ncbi:uncharacterized protein F5147DRAFT_350819 [Suillus discolor]|uniref:Uncharacterized protein n=1 Tax=Suillus discolor TaxID=1912936 RepID=A0A9P7FG28_9AGAM|nr:uncharacterized protein F5147DRAFT_350819 [Suillus discolor]KAG2116623.1 hypothetical protein F5147DRAFT_350819 [Suillus discolor]